MAFLRKIVPVNVDFEQKSKNLQSEPMSRTLSKLTFGTLHLKLYLGIRGSYTSNMDAHPSMVRAAEGCRVLYRPKKKVPTETMSR